VDKRPLPLAYEPPDETLTLTAPLLDTLPLAVPDTTPSWISTPKLELGSQAPRDLHGPAAGGGEVVRYMARHGESRVAKAVLIAAVPPLMVKTPANSGGLPKEVFDGFQAQLAANRSQFYRDVAAGPFYGYNRPGAKPSEAVIGNWWRQGMMGGAKAHYDGIVAFSQTDFTEDLKKITVPVLVMHSEDDQIVPYADSGPLSAKLLKMGTLKTYKEFPHGMPTTQAETINADLLSFLKVGT
jgi:non-heme chloroperoxidase